MLRYPLNVDHREIGRLIRAAREAGAAEVIIERRTSPYCAIGK
jgi:hypothetical protein